MFILKKYVGNVIQRIPPECLPETEESGSLQKSVNIRWVRAHIAKQTNVVFKCDSAAKPLIHQSLLCLYAATSQTMVTFKCSPTSIPPLPPSVELGGHIDAPCERLTPPKSDLLQSATHWYQTASLKATQSIAAGQTTK